MTSIYLCNSFTSVNQRGNTALRSNGFGLAAPLYEWLMTDLGEKDHIKIYCVVRTVEIIFFISYNYKYTGVWPLYGRIPISITLMQFGTDISGRLFFIIRAILLRIYKTLRKWKLVVSYILTKESIKCNVPSKFRFCWWVIQ